MKTNSRFIGVRVPESLALLLEKQAGEKKTSVSEIIRASAESFLAPPSAQLGDRHDSAGSLGLRSSSAIPSASPDAGEADPDPDSGSVRPPESPSTGTLSPAATPALFLDSVAIEAATLQSLARLPLIPAVADVARHYDGADLKLADDGSGDVLFRAPGTNEYEPIAGSVPDEWLRTTSGGGSGARSPRALGIDQSGSDIEAKGRASQKFYEANRDEIMAAKRARSAKR